MESVNDEFNARKRILVRTRKIRLKIDNPARGERIVEINHHANTNPVGVIHERNNKNVIGSMNTIGKMDKLTFHQTTKPPVGGFVVCGVGRFLQSYHPYGVLFACKEKFEHQHWKALMMNLMRENESLSEPGKLG